MESMPDTEADEKDAQPEVKKVRHTNIAKKVPKISQGTVKDFNEFLTNPENEPTAEFAIDELKNNEEMAFALDDPSDMIVYEENISSNTDVEVTQPSDVERNIPVGTVPPLLSTAV
ncbi:uncharacterized protein LOC131678593 [Topomyia yanbarensis]|uniref:uncharacterized protein LOC131678593 n=1 Tax=Topomyia yanbarensis TaxID=2498891 RepID=UPI00273CAD2F|nr:uncharacterized protein LOC131678593 [Topomyia yanbarensis]